MRMRRGGRAQWASVSLALLARGAAYCLEQPGELQKVEYNGAMYSIPIGHGGWASPRILFNIVTILLREKMYVDVAERGSLGSSTSILKSIAGCSSDMACSEQEWAAGQFSHPPETWLAAEVWITSAENRRLFQYVQSVGFVGYTSTPSLNAYPHVFSMAVEEERVFLGYYQFLATPHASKFFSDQPSMDEAIRSLGWIPGTNNNQEWNASHLEQEGIRVEDGWFISPLCDRGATSGTRVCIPVVLGHPEWNFREWCKAAINTGMPFAVTFLGWIGEQGAVRSLNGTHSFLFYWWTPDPSFLSLGPEMVYFAEERIEISQFQQTQKIVWNGLSDAAPNIFEFLTRVQLSAMDMRTMMERWYDQTPYELACSWLQNRTNTWQAWLPQEMDCGRGFFFSNETGSCVQCLPGTFKDRRGPAACAACEQGFYAGEAQASNCTACTPGAYNNQRGATECDFCWVGSYQPGTGMATCVECPSPLTTASIAARFSTSCACPADMYRTSDGCHPCEEGMDCPFGSDMRADVADYPQVQPGFMTLASDPLRVYRCPNEDMCPGGGPASCAPNLDPAEVACGSCVPGYYNSDGMCALCRGGTRAIPVLLALLSALLCVALTFYMASDSTNLLIQSNAMVSVVIVLSFLCTSIQTLSVFREMPVNWAPPLALIQEAVRIIAFDIGVVRAECLLGVNPIWNYMARQLVVPFAAVFVVLGLLLKKFSPVGPFRKPHMRLFSEFVSIFGTGLNVFFISVLLSAIAPFICYPHPGGDYSVFSAPSVLCWNWGGRFPAMVTAAVFSLLMVPVPFVALTIFAIWIYPSAVSTLTESSHFHKIRFLFFRFRPNRYYYFVILLARNTAICFVPVFLPGAGALQISLASWILGFSTLVQQRLVPWRSKVCNLVEGGVSISLMLSLLCSALVTEASASGSAEIQVIGSFAVASLAVSLFGPLAYFGYKRLRGKKPYQWFICHHKGHAAAQARYIKSLFQARQQKVFIDSDDLVDLNQLFDIVKTQVRRLMVYLTSETLKRQWCTGEIVTATRHGIRITPVRTRGFRPPTTDELETLDTYLAPADSSLQHYGITLKDIKDTYAQFLVGKFGGVELNESALGVRRFHELVLELDGKRPDVQEQARTRLPRTEGMVSIVSTHHSNESIAASGVLVEKIREKLLGIVGGSYCNFCDHEENLGDIVEAVKVSRAVIIMLTPESMTSLPQLVAIVQAMAMQEEGASGGLRSDAVAHENTTSRAHAVIPVNTQSFIFPDESYFLSVLPRIWPAPGHDLSAHGLPFGFAKHFTLDRTRALIKSMFLLIAVLFPTHASDRELEVQATRMIHRLKSPGADAVRTSARSSTGTGSTRSSTGTGRTSTGPSGDKLPPHKFISKE